MVDQFGACQQALDYRIRPVIAGNTIQVTWAKQLFNSNSFIFTWTIIPDGPLGLGQLIMAIHYRTNSINYWHPVVQLATGSTIHGYYVHSLAGMERITESPSHTKLLIDVAGFRTFSSQIQWFPFVNQIVCECMFCIVKLLFCCAYNPYDMSPKERENFSKKECFLFLTVSSKFSLSSLSVYILEVWAWMCGMAQN